MTDLDLFFDSSRT